METAHFGLSKLGARLRLEGTIKYALFCCAAISILTTAAIVIILGVESVRFFTTTGVRVIDFLTGRVWQPLIGQFGILPLISATAMTTIIATLFAAPVGLCAAIYLSELSPRRVRAVVRPIIEMLAGIPTIVYGYFALGALTPMLQRIFGEDLVNIYNTGSAGLAIGILILPLIISLTEDAMRAVPQSIREAAYSVGATPIETSLRVVAPASASGIVAALIIGITRAVGETMIVALAAGAGPKLTANPFESAETITGYIVRISGGDISYNSPDYLSIFVLGFALFLLTLALNAVSRMIVRRFQWQGTVE